MFFDIFELERDVKLFSVKMNIKTGIVDGLVIHTKDKHAETKVKIMLMTYKTHMQQVSKYLMIMQYMTHCKKHVTVKEHRELSRSESKQIRRSGVDVAPLVRTVYEIAKVPKRLPKVKRSSPSHQFNVRGHYRHYKNGRVVWVTPYAKCKDKERQPKTYNV